jgi:outer membrane lipoprotein SlyB
MIVPPICRAVPSNDGESRLVRSCAALPLLALAILALAGCGPSYSPDTYASNAVQQANKVDSGVVVGVRPVQISAQGAIGGVAGAAAGGVAGSQVGVGTTSTFAAIGGSLLGGIAGVTAEHVVGDTNGFEYIVRKPNGDLISVAQKEEKPLRLGQKVLVISGAQARIVPDYTVPYEGPAKAEAQKTDAPKPDASAPKPAEAKGPEQPATNVAPPQLPSAFGSPPVPIMVNPTGSEVPSAIVAPLVQGVARP